MTEAPRNEMLPIAAVCLIIARVARRIHVRDLRPGTVEFSADQAHHARDVLRLHTGDAVELFDDAGRFAGATIVECTARRVRADVAEVREPEATKTNVIRLTVAAAVPKGDRADWMVEKLSELGVALFVPLAAARSVVLPEGRNKRDRWMRLATESAKQSRRPGIMQIAELTALDQAIAGSSISGSSWCLSTAPGARPVAEVISAGPTIDELTLFVGPEGGWTDAELNAFAAGGIAHVTLTQSILRVETAAVAAAAVAMSLLPFNPKSTL